MQNDLLKRYTEGNASMEERAQVLLWAKADENNMKELLALRKLHDITIWQQETGRQTKQQTRRFIYRIASIAAVFALLVGMGAYTYYIQKQIPETVMQTINVPAGQRVELILADGTSVWLNAGSTFTFPTNFTSKTREVRLDGEAYFDVEKDKKREFVVKTSSYDVKVLGTEFNILAYSKSPLFEVALLKGSVDVYSSVKNEKISLEPSTRAYLSGNKLTKGIIENYNNFLWKNGLICFDDEPVEKMTAKLELYFDTKIIINNPSFKTKKYTGKFWTKDGIEHIFRVFQLKEHFTYEKNDETNTITIN